MTLSKFTGLSITSVPNCAVLISCSKGGPHGRGKRQRNCLCNKAREREIDMGELHVSGGLIYVLIVQSRAVKDSCLESAPEYDFDLFGDSGSGSKGVEPLAPIPSLMPIPQPCSCAECHTGYGENLNSTQAKPIQAISSGVAYFPLHFL